MNITVPFELSGVHKRIWPSLRCYSASPPSFLIDQKSYDFLSIHRRVSNVYRIVNEEECFNIMVAELADNKEAQEYVEAKWREYRSANGNSC